MPVTISRVGGEFVDNDITVNSQLLFDAVRRAPATPLTTSTPLAVLYSDDALTGNLGDVRMRFVSPTGNGTSNILVAGGAGVQTNARAVTLADGRTFVVYEDYNNSASLGSEIRAKMYSATGTLVSTFTVVNTGYTTGNQYVGGLTLLTDGTMVLTYFDATTHNLLAQRLASNGANSGTAVILATDANANGMNSSVTALADGGYAVAYVSDITTGTQAIRTFNADGTARAGSFSFTAGTGTLLEIAQLTDGTLAVAAQGIFSGTSGRSYEIRSLHLGADLVQIGTTTVHYAGSQNVSVGGVDVVALPGGQYAVAWSAEVVIDRRLIYVQAFGADSVAVSDVFTVDGTPNGVQLSPRLTDLGDGTVAVSWTDYSQTFSDTSGAGVHTQLVTFGGVGATSGLTGTVYNDTLTGTTLGETFNIAQGGSDAIAAGGGNDTVNLGQTFDYTDRIDGGIGNDTLVISGTNRLRLTGEMMTSIETLRIVQASTTFAESIVLTFDDTLLAAGQQLRIDAIDLGTVDALAIDASAELDGSLLFYGGTGNSNVIGTGGNDFIYGGYGDDTLRGGGGVDRIEGGDGADTVYVDALSAGSIVNGGGNVAPEMDRLYVMGNVALADCRAFEWVELVGTTLTLGGAAGAAQLGYNAIIAGTGTIVVNMDPGVIFAATNNQFAAGANVLLRVNGTAGTDVIKGFLNGRNEINGGDGADQVRGGDLVDTIDGGAGNDKIMGLAGADVLTGGAGADQFRILFAGDSGVGAGNRDRILDFVSGEDRIDFRGLDANPNVADRQTLSFAGTSAFHATGAGEVRYQVAGSDLLVQIDLDGNGTADMELLLQGAGGQTLTATDFLF